MAPVHSIADHLVERACRHPAAVLCGYPGDLREDPPHPQAGPGRKKKNRRIPDKRHLRPEPLLILLGCPGSLLHQVPFVHHQDGGPAGLVRDGGHLFILFQQEFSGIQEDQGDIGPLHRLDRPEHTVILHRIP